MLLEVSWVEIVHVVLLPILVDEFDGLELAILLAIVDDAVVTKIKKRNKS